MILVTEREVNGSSHSRRARRALSRGKIMKTFKIPGSLCIAKDEYGRLEAFEDDELWGQTVKARIIIKMHDGVLGDGSAGTPEEYLGQLRRRAINAYKRGDEVIEA